MALPLSSPSSWPVGAGPLSAVLIGMLGWTGGCHDSTAIAPGDIRRYAVPAVEATRPTTRAPSATAALRRDADPAGAASRGPRLTYTVPEGWTDRGGGGLRLATLAIGDPADGREVTVIPAAGTLESNVSRWQRQLDPDSDPGTTEAVVRMALDDAVAVPVGTSSATVVFLTDAAARAADDATEGRAILGAMIPLDESASLFVKFMGEAAVARREQERFVEFVKTIRWQ